MNNKKWVMKEFVVPFLIMLGITGVGIAAFMITIGKGSNIAPINTVAGEITKPTSGRLIYVICSMLAFVLCAVLAEKFARKDKLYPAFYLGFVAGMLLWQSVGEGSWHFGYTLGSEYINFVHIEVTTSLFLVITFGLFTAYLMKNRLLGFGILCTLLSFLCNWYGHFVSEGTFPFVANVMDMSTWLAISGVAFGVIISAAAIILAIRKYKDTRGHLLCSMLLYVGIAIISFGFIE